MERKDINQIEDGAGLPVAVLVRWSAVVPFVDLPVGDAALQAYQLQSGLSTDQITHSLSSLEARRALAQGTRFSTVTSSRCEGCEVWSDVSMDPIGGDDWVLRLADVTEETRAALAAPAAPAPLALDDVVADLQSGLVLLRADGPFGRVNPAAAELLGVRTLAGARRQLAALAGDVFAAPVTRLAVREDEAGTVRTLAIAASPLDLAGRPASLVTITDLTGTMETPAPDTAPVATINHEMRTPLTSLIGSLDLMEQGLADQDRSRKLLSMSRRNAARLLDLVEDLMATHESAHDALSVDVGQVDAGSALAEAVEANASFAATHGITLCVEADDADILIAADGRRLQQVLTNLISNAVKYSGTSRVVHLSLQTVGSDACFTVRDQGLGIPSADLPHIFGRYYRVSDDSHQGIKGTGLGLSITRDLVHRMGGDITARSSTGSGSGSVFTVKLPRLEAQVATG